MSSRLLSYPLLAAMFAVSPLAQATTMTNGGYTATDAVTFQWNELATPSNTAIAGATRVLGSNDDSATGAVNLGFNFMFFDQTYNQAYITSNGLLTFGGTTTNNNNINNYALGDAFNFNTSPMIAAAWDDWTTTYSGTDAVYYSTQGSPGNQRFIVEWHDTKRYDPYSNSNSSPVSFAAVLFEGSNAIELLYLDMETGGSQVYPDASRGATATTGIRDINAYANGNYLQWSHDQTVLLNNSAIRFTPVAAAVPEPASFALFLIGVAGLGAVRRRRN